jgi:hypothetical protein
MKYLFIALLTLAGALPAAAQSGVQNVHEVALTTQTITQTINLCASGGAVDVTAATSSGTLAGAYAIEVYNIGASTVTINCGQDVALSTDTNSDWYGREAAAGIGLFYAVPPSTRKTRCMTQNSSGCTRVTITQLK